MNRGHGLPMGVIAYESLRDAIVVGRLGAGAQLVQEQLAEQLGVSRTPVRDALNRLTHEGLVTWHPGLGYTVNPLDDDDIRHVQQVREPLERLAIELACGRLDRVQVAKIELLIEEMATADPGDAGAQYALNRRFHQTMIEPCDNPILLGMLEQLWDYPLSRRITRSYIQHPGNVPRMIEEHREILQASLSGDCQRLIALVTAHIREGYGDTLTGPGRIEPDSSGTQARPEPGLPDTENSFIPPTSST